MVDPHTSLARAVATVALAFSVAGCPSPTTPSVVPVARVQPTPSTDAQPAADRALDGSIDAALDGTNASDSSDDSDSVDASDASDTSDVTDARASQIVDGGFVYDGAFVSLRISERARRAEAIPEGQLSDDPSFTDPPALEALARNPLWRAEQPGRTRDEDPLRCHYGTSSQSCVAEPCHAGVGEPCRAECGNTCISCDNECRPGCYACNAECTTDACRARCARSCGRCLDRCRSLRDRCVTGECGRRESACYRQFGRDFVRQCLPTCRRCYQRCESEDEPMPCTVRCARTSGRCNPDQVSWCAMTGPVDPNHVEDGS